MLTGFHRIKFNCTIIHIHIPQQQYCRSLQNPLIKKIANSYEDCEVMYSKLWNTTVPWRIQDKGNAQPMTMVTLFYNLWSLGHLRSSDG